MLFLVPFAIIPILIRTFYDARLALFILLIAIMLAAFFITDPLEFVFMNFISGMVAIFTLTNIYRKAKLFFYAVEASSRSLEKHTAENINELVERILYLQEQDGQFSDVPLTFKDISDIKTAFKKRLSTIYHLRIAYPERDL